MKDQEMTVRQTSEKPSQEEMNAQFGEFLRTKGVKAKFRLAFSNMKESAARQHAEDRANFEAVKQQSAEENAEFVEFLHTKGVKAKAELVAENIRRGAAEARQSPALPEQTEAQPVSAEALTEMFQTFLQENGLDYDVKVTGRQ